MKTLHSYQDQRGAVLLSASTPYFNHSFVNNPSSTSLWGEGIGNSVSSFVQTTENKLSQWFWQSISALPKGYFSAKDITSVNHFDKSLWEGMFNERVEDLKEQLKSTLTLQQKDFHYQILSENEHANIDKLKEQMAAGLPNNDKLSLKEQLTALQGLVGKHTLSPQDYEDGLDGLKEAAPDNNYYATLIEQVRSSFRSTLKTHQGLLEECLQSDLIRLFKESSEKSLTSAPLKKILRYYKPLMKHKQYAKQREWIEQCYNTQSLLPIPSARKHITRLPSRDLSNIENKQDSPTWGSCIRNLGKLLWDNSGKLMTLGLATQVTAVQAFNNRAQGDLVPEGNLTDRSSMMLDINQTFPTVNTTLLGLNEGYVPNPSSELDTLMPQNTSAEESTTTDGYEVDNKVVTRLINATDISNAEPYDRHMEVDPVMSQNKSIEERVAADIYGLDDKVVALPINATNISEVDQRDRRVEISEELRQEILRQFDIIGSDLQELIKMFSTNEDNNKPLGERSNQTTLTRVVRTLPIDESPTCEVEQGTLISFRNELQATLNGTNQAGNNNCPLNYNSDACEELLKLMLCGYNHLKNRFIQSIANSASLGEATMWKNKFEEYKEKSTRLLDGKITSLSQKYGQEIDKLKTDTQNLQGSLNTAVDQLKERTVKSCISEISSGKISSAVNDFKELKDDSKLPEIIRSVYTEYGNVSQVQNIVNFVKKLSSCNQDRIAYPVLFDVMREKNGLTSPKVLIVSDNVKTCMRDSSLDNNLALYARGVIDSWSTRIRDDNYEQVLESIKEGCGHFVDSHWSQIIEKAYASNLNNAENILKFIRSLPCINQTARSLTVLFYQIKNNNDLDSYQLLMVADKIKQELDFVNNNSNFGYGPGGRQYYENIYESLKNSLPSSVRGLIWNGSSCTVKNRGHYEYLYAANDYHNFNSDSGKVFTWVPGGTVREAYWKFETEDNAKSFTMKNNYWNKYMFASGFHTKNSDRRWVFYWTSGDKVTQGYWKLTPVNNAELFTIKNTVHNEFLYADGDMSRQGRGSDRRGVFTWRTGTPQGVMERESQWEISC